MSRAWNGESLVDELSALLGDTSAAFKSRVLAWLNDVVFDISTRHDWNHQLVKGKKILAPEEEIHPLEIEAPGACEIELDDDADGALASGSDYSVLVTFEQDNGVESVAGEVSDTVTATDSQKALYLTDIPTSLESLVTKRNIYLKKDDGPYYYSQTISDNFTTTLTITDDTDSTIEAPDYEGIRRLNGSPFFEEGQSNYLEYLDLDDLRRRAQGQWEAGDPEFFSPVESNSIAVYPVPSSEKEVSFYYYRMPKKLYYDESSQPDLPIYLKQALKAGVISMGYEYRDREGQEIKKANYENAVFDAINRGGRVANIEYAVKDFYGAFEGGGV
jgi:hypothetical protein